MQTRSKITLLQRSLQTKRRVRTQKEVKFIKNPVGQVAHLLSPIPSVLQRPKKSLAPGSSTKRMR